MSMEKTEVRRSYLVYILLFGLLCAGVAVADYLYLREQKQSSQSSRPAQVGEEEELLAQLQRLEFLLGKKAGTLRMPHSVTFPQLVAWLGNTQGLPVGFTELRIPNVSSDKLTIHLQGIVATPSKQSANQYLQTYARHLEKNCPAAHVCKVDTKVSASRVDASLIYFTTQVYLGPK